MPWLFDSVERTNPDVSTRSAADPSDGVSAQRPPCECPKNLAADGSFYSLDGMITRKTKRRERNDRVDSFLSGCPFHIWSKAERRTMPGPRNQWLLNLQTRRERRGPPIYRAKSAFVIRLSGKKAGCQYRTERSCPSLNPECPIICRFPLGKNSRIRIKC